MAMVSLDVPLCATVLKRAMDVVTYSFGIFALCPLMLFAAVIIRLDSPVQSFFVKSLTVSIDNLSAF